MEFEAVIGLEVHAQLLTKSKIFCLCSTAFGAAPNSNTCPVCLGLPGALPVLNKEAVAMAVMAAVGLGCEINQSSLFARKNYFYPDLPKGYQISQFDLPLAGRGEVEILVGNRDAKGTLNYEEKSFRIHRIHLEDDAGKSIHVPEGDTLVNLNRTGTPLIEIVTEADFRSSQEAYDFLNHLRRVLLYLEVCDGNMEEGSLRCDANVSVRPRGESRLGTKTEIKNLNSFRFLKKALDYEIERQVQVIREGGRIEQETRLWNEESQMTLPMRTKEEAHDYRYFPEPDLLPVVISDEWLKELKGRIPELPAEKRKRFVSEYGLETEPALILTQSRAFAEYFESAVRTYSEPTSIFNWMMGDLTRDLKRENLEIQASPISPAHLARLVELIDRDVISGKIAKEVFSRMFTSGEDPETIIEEQGLEQISSEDELSDLVDSIVKQHPDKVKAYQSGKEGLIGFFVGQLMRETKGKANPQLANELLRERLSGEK